MSTKTVIQKYLIKMVRKTQDAKNAHFCSTCDKVIRGSRFKFNCHKFSHREVKPRYTCDYCLKEYFRSDTFTKHLRSHIKSSKSYTLINPYSQYKHLEIKHKVVKKPSSKKYSCKVCSISYCEYRLLVRHIRRTHFNYNFKQPLYVRMLPNETWIEKVFNTNVYVEMTKLSNNIIVIKRSTQIKNEINVEDNQSIFSHNQIDDKMHDSKNVTLEKIIAIKNGRQDWNGSQELFLTDDRSYSKAVCGYCKKEMLKKSLIKHLKEKHFKMTQFKCETCNYYFKRQYQRTNHICGQYQSKSSQKAHLK